MSSEGRASRGLIFRVYKATAIAITAGIGTSDTFTGGSQDGMIYFTEAIVRTGFRVRPVLSAIDANLQARPFASGDQVVLDFRSTAVQAMPVGVSVEARGVFSSRLLRMGDARSKADVLTKYGGFKTSSPTANNGTLTSLRAPGVEPTFTVVTLPYQ